MKIEISPSILSANFGKLNEEIAGLEEFADSFHIDVMDGHFVPNITIGPCVVKSINSKKILDVHLMIENPENYIEEFIKVGGDKIVIHSEACLDLRKVLNMIVDLGAKAGVSIKPKTPVSDIEGVLDIVDEVLVMTVEPGFGGQKFMNDVLPKIEKLRKLKPDLNIAVDGGINKKTAKLVRDAGANILISGSFIFKAENRIKALESLRG